ncbi:MAG TPA: hypothetical protein VL401_01660 [Alphaproteobacteria bacterium]|jgi:hypothetical protein|nr:hypothetical protein [Alphaproteobacteria bacterium]
MKELQFGQARQNNDRQPRTIRAGTQDRYRDEKVKGKNSSRFQRFVSDILPFGKKKDKKIPED